MTPKNPMILQDRARPKVGDVMQERGRGKVRVVMVGMKYADIVDPETGGGKRKINLHDLIPIERATPPAPKKTLTMSDLDREFLGDL